MTLMDEAVAVRSGEELDAGRLGAYLSQWVPGLVGPPVIRQFPAGFSNLTYLLTVGDRQFVLRRPPIGTRPRSGHDMSREFRVLSALAPSFAECPRPIHHCADESIIGAPFYVVQRIRGIILRRDYPDGLATPSLVRAQQLALIETLARLHAVDCRSSELAGLGRPEGYVARQVAGWSERYARAHTTDAAPADMVTAWLAANLPQESSPPAVIHNDFKLDNVVFGVADPARLVGVLDWEMATLGDPLMDLGCSLAYWVQADDNAGLFETRMLPTHLPGSLKRSDVLESYARATGRVMPDFLFYRIFGLFRLAVIVQQIYYRFFHGETGDPRFGSLGPLGRVLIAEAAAEIRAGT